jgi:hypothetical protein
MTPDKTQLVFRLAPSGGTVRYAVAFANVAAACFGSLAWVRNEDGTDEKYRMGSLPVCIEAAAEMQPEGITLILKHAADMVYSSDDDDIDDVADAGRGASEAADSGAPVPSNRAEETPSEPTTKRRSARLRRK